MEERVLNNRLWNAKLLWLLMAVLQITDWLVPQYFGFHIGFDFTATRILNLLLLGYFLLNREAGNAFFQSMTDVQMSPFLGLYMMVMTVTAILRINVNTFFLNFFDIITFYLVCFGIRYVIGLKRTVRWCVTLTWILVIYGLIEYALGFSPMIELLKTLPNDAAYLYRSGQYRIMGPCVHAIAYGMLLLLLLAVICIDPEHDEINLFQHPVLYLLVILNLFLTGSRGPLGLAILESLAIILASRRKKRQKTLIVLVGILVGLILLELLILRSSLGQYIMMQLMSLVDQAFGTSYSGFFGGNTEVLRLSSSYRDLLPRVFTVEWLNPLLGQGANAHITFEFDGIAIESIDNFYVAAYIRYGYPGLIAFGLFILSSIYYPLKSAVRFRSGISWAVGIAMTIYWIGLWWVDYLQTTKYMYFVLAIYCGYHWYRKEQREIGERQICEKAQKAL